MFFYHNQATPAIRKDRVWMITTEDTLSGRFLIIFHLDNVVHLERVKWEFNDRQARDLVFSGLFED